MLVDPDGWLHDRQALLMGLWAEVQNPKQFGKDMVDWDTWAHDPARAAGHLMPDVALALLTAGVGTAASKGTTAATRIAEEAAEETAEAGAKTAAKEAAETAAEQGPKRYSDEEIGVMTPGDGTLILKARADLTPQEITQMTDYVRVANSARLEGELSETGRVSTDGELRRLANQAAAAERARAEAAGTPYGKLCLVTGLTEALNPGKDESHGSTEEVPGRASGAGDPDGGRSAA